MKKLILVLLTLSLSCGNNNSNNVTISNKTEEPVQFVATTQTTLLNTVVASIIKTLPREDSNKFIEPSSNERNTFATLVSAILKNNLGSAESSAKSLNYNLSTVLDKETGLTYYILTEKSTKFRGLGTYIFSPKYVRNVFVEVPHPISDFKTDEEGVKILKGIGARGLFIAGTHRCSNSTYSTCNGTTKSCNGKDESFRTSDAGHFMNNFFNEAHKSTLALSPKPITISLHGNDDDIPDILLSNGTEVKSASNVLVNRLRNELKTNVGSCNLKGEPNYNLCGTTNVQGMLSNGLVGCSMKAKTTTELFLHIEQHLNVRSNPTKLITALKAVLPEGK